MNELRVYELLEVSAWGGIGVLLAIALLAATRTLLPPAQRHRLRIPIGLLMAHVGVIAVELMLPGEPVVRRPIRVLAIALLLFSMGRTAFLLAIQIIMGRRQQVPLPRIIQDILQGVIYAAISLVVLRAAGVELSSILTTSALLTAVIGLSLQETLGNLFAGLAIQAQRPFEVGDWIQFDPDIATIGRVVEINWRATRVITIDNIEITVPNGALARASIRNFNKPTPEVRRWVQIVVDASVPPAQVQRMFLEALAGTDGVLAHPPPDVQTLGFNERGVEYRIRYWMTAFDRREPIDGAVRDRLWYALQRAGLSNPPAQRAVFVHETGERGRQEQQSRATEDRGRTLRYVDLFRDLPAPALEAIARSAQRRLYAAGEVVIQEGQPGDELFVVESGEVEVLINRDRMYLRVAALGPGRFFGEMSLMTGEPRRATVRAVQASALLAVGKREIQPVLEAHPALLEKISTALAEREVALDAQRVTSEKDRKSMVSERSDALLARIRSFFSL